MSMGDIVTSHYNMGATFWVISKNHDAAPTKFWISHQWLLEVFWTSQKIVAVNLAIQECQMKGQGSKSDILDSQIEGSDFLAPLPLSTLKWKTDWFNLLTLSSCWLSC